MWHTSHPCILRTKFNSSLMAPTFNSFHHGVIVAGMGKERAVEGDEDVERGMAIGMGGLWMVSDVSTYLFFFFLILVLFLLTLSL